MCVCVGGGGDKMRHLAVFILNKKIPLYIGSARGGDSWECRV